MKWSSTIRPACDNCRVVRRNGAVMVICRDHRRRPATPEGDKS